MFIRSTESKMTTEKTFTEVKHSAAAKADLKPYAYVAEDLKRHILAKRYSKDSPLPSSRTLALQYGVSRSTILVAFDQLAREGLLRVSQGLAPVVIDCHATTQSQQQCLESQMPILESQMPIKISPHLPVQKWFGAITKLAKKAQSKGSFIEPAVMFELKVALRNYLNRQRRLSCQLEQIFIFENTTAAMCAIATAFSLSSDRRVLIDAPNLAASARQLARFCNFIEALNIASLIEEPVNGFVSFQPPKSQDSKLGSLLYTTPSTRLGSTRSLDQASRQRLIDWAKENNCHILEHDYGHEYCSGPASQPAIFSLDRSSSVTYLVDFTSSLSPLTNLCALVLPNALVHLFKRHHSIEQSSCSVFESQTLTTFLSSGFLERHCRKSGQQCLQNLAEMKRLVTERLPDKHVQIKLIKSGKDAILEVENDDYLDILKPAFDQQLIKPNGQLFGAENSSRKLILAGDYLDEENRELLLACLMQYSSRLNSCKGYSGSVYVNSVPAAVLS